jgi:ABC-2 type transport system ATP-binding protein
MLEARALRKTYGDVVALVGLDLSIGAGEVFAMLGANGAGKTTTIHLFLGFQRPDSGAALVGGRDVNEDPQAARGAVAFVPDQVHLYPRFSGLENLGYLLRLATGRKHERAELEALFTRVGLERSAFERELGTYSKGMRQRVGIAAAIGKGAKVLLLDEPTTGLDPKASNDFARLVREVADTGVAVLMATHDVFRSATTADRVGVMRAGELVLELGTQGLDPRALEQAYLAAVFGGAASEGANSSANPGASGAPA